VGKGIQKNDEEQGEEIDSIAVSKLSIYEFHALNIKSKIINLKEILNKRKSEINRRRKQRESI
jgi:hypothetical protein